MTVKIIQMKPMPNDPHWQGHVLGLGDDGVVYIDDHTNGLKRWVEYMPAVFDDGGHNEN